VGASRGDVDDLVFPSMLHGIDLNGSKLETRKTGVFFLSPIVAMRENKEARSKGRRALGSPGY
jgi:hypothetical protein